MKPTAFLADYGPRLLAQGYPIVPIRPGKKHPGFKGWEKTHADEHHVRRWIDNGFRNGGVGVLTKHFPAVDLDVQDSAIVALLIAWCEKHLGTTVMRVGKAPKTLLVYRTDEPFAKVASAKYVDFTGLEHKVEILGDGQQFVAYAIHPDTKRPYVWPGDELADVPAADLPGITKAQAEALVAYFESLIPDDWERVEAAPSTREIDTSTPEPERVLSHAKPKLDIPTVKIERALRLLDPDMSMREWVRVGMALHHQFDGDTEGFALWDGWSAGGSKYNGREMRSRWRSFAPDLRSTNPVTAATIIKMAREVHDRKKAVGDEKEGAPLLELDTRPVGALAGAPIKPRQWLVEGLIPAGDITLLNGDGGTGKSLLSLQLAVSVATGTPWLGQPVARGRSLFITAEDTADELHRRLDRVLKHEDIDYETVGDEMHTLSLAGENAILAAPERGNILQATEVFEALKRALERIRPSLLVLDTLADLFGGEENQRAQARQFIGLLRGLCIELDSTIILLAHPSLSGLASGSGTSGSTGWNNSVRSRLYLERVIIKDEGGPLELDPDARQLTSKKANYGPTGTCLDLRWEDGVFVNMTDTEFSEGGSAEEKAERVFTDLLRLFTEQERTVSPNKSSMHAPSVFAGHPAAEGVTKARLERAMNALLTRGDIVVKVDGPQSRRRSFLVFKETK